MTYEKMDNLPNKLSSLLSLALDDMEKVQKDDRYILDMDYYHKNSICGNGYCLVCLAGSVMAKTLESDITRSSHPYDYNFSTCNKLLAIDSLRRFDLIGAKEYLLAANSNVYRGPGDYYYNLFLSKLNHVFRVLLLLLRRGKVPVHLGKYIKTYRRYVRFLRLLRL